MSDEVRAKAELAVRLMRSRGELYLKGWLHVQLFLLETIQELLLAGEDIGTTLQGAAAAYNAMIEVAKEGPNAEAN